MSESPTIQCLIVDDLEENLIALEALLAEPGVEVLRARSKGSTDGRDPRYDEDDERQRVIDEDVRGA